MNKYGITVLDEYHTIKKLSLGEHSLARYGDGELELVFNTGLNYFKNKLLMRGQKTFGNGGFFFNRRLKKILTSDKDNLLIGIPNVFNEDSPIKWKSQYYYNNIPRMLDLLDCEQEYASLFYIRYNKKDERKETHWERVTQIWDSKRIAIINFNPELAKHPLFSNAVDIKFIECHQRKAYGHGLRYKKLLNRCLAVADDVDMLLVSAGPVANLLADDLSKKNHICIDIGQLAKLYNQSKNIESEHFY